MFFDTGTNSDSRHAGESRKECNCRLENGKILQPDQSWFCGKGEHSSKSDHYEA